jgi:hypothetical protein
MAKQPFWHQEKTAVKPQSKEERARILEEASKPEAPSRDTRVELPRATDIYVAPPERSRSYADLLQRLYREFDVTADSIATEADPVRRADALTKLARALPLMQAAEENANTRINKKAVKDLTDAELERLLNRPANKAGPKEVIKDSTDSDEDF